MIAHDCDFVIFLGGSDSEAGSGDISFSGVQGEIGGLNFELNGFAEFGGVLNVLVEGGFSGINLGGSNAVVENIPGCGNTGSPSIVVAVAERRFAVDTFGGDGVDAGQIAGFSGTHGRFSLLDSEIGGGNVRAVFEREGDAVSEIQIVALIGELFHRTEQGIGGQEQEIAERGDGNVVLVLRGDESLLSVGEADFSSEHVSFGDGTGAELRVDVVEVLVQRADVFLVDFDFVAGAQDIEIIIRGGEAHSLQGIFQRQVSGVEPVACGNSAFLVAVTGVERHGNAGGVAEKPFIVVGVLTAADGFSLRRPA